MFFGVLFIIMIIDGESGRYHDVTYFDCDQLSNQKYIGSTFTSDVMLFHSNLALICVSSAIFVVEPRWGT